MLTRKLLEKEPYLERIDILNTSNEAADYLEQLEKKGSAFPHAIFIDIDMPMISGLELAEQLHQDYLKNKPDTKVFILSSSISQRDRHIAEGLDAVHDYMEKPLSTALLRKALGITKKQQLPQINTSDAQKENDHKTHKN